MNSRAFVEDCFVLTPRDVGRRLDRIRKLGINSLDRSPGLNYWFDNMSDPKRLFISVDGQEPQEFRWEVVDITFGEKEYFYCPCGHRAVKLYLPPASKEFKCQKCHQLRYQLTSFNKQSIAGQTLYKFNRMQKLADSRAQIGRVLYNGVYTKRFERFLGLCDRAGYNSIVTGARDLMTLIKQ